MNKMNRVLLMLIAMVSIMLLAVGIDRGIKHWEEKRWESEREAFYEQSRNEIREIQTTIQTLSEDPQALTAYMEENGITIRYDEDGREWYKNKENEVNNKGGGELWLPVLAGEALSRQRESVQQDNLDLIEGVKEELYEEYVEKVLSASYKSKARESRRTRWEEKVKRELAKYAVPEQEITEFISQVKSGYFGSDAYYEEDEEYEDDDE